MSSNSFRTCFISLPFVNILCSGWWCKHIRTWERCNFGIRIFLASDNIQCMARTVWIENITARCSQAGHGTRDVKHYGSWCFKNTNCQWMSGLPLTSSPPPSIHHQMMPPLQHSEQYICNIYVLYNSRWHGSLSTQDRSYYLIYIFFSSKNRGTKRRNLLPQDFVDL